MSSLIIITKGIVNMRVELLKKLKQKVAKSVRLVRWETSEASDKRMC